MSTAHIGVERGRISISQEVENEGTFLFSVCLLCRPRYDVLGYAGDVTMSMSSGGSMSSEVRLVKEKGGREKMTSLVVDVFRWGRWSAIWSQASFRSVPSLSSSLSVLMNAMMKQTEPGGKVDPPEKLARLMISWSPSSPVLLFVWSGMIWWITRSHGDASKEQRRDDDVSWWKPSSSGSFDLCLIDQIKEISDQWSDPRLPCLVVRSGQKNGNDRLEPSGSSIDAWAGKRRLPLRVGGLIKGVSTKESDDRTFQVSLSSRDPVEVCVLSTRKTIE
jgi:hypothetical protein